MGRLINKGIKTKIIAKGNIFTVGTNYTATLYYNVKNQDGRASVTSQATSCEDKACVIFEFSPDDTKKLKVGNVILEIYDSDGLEQMAFVNNFAIVRANSLSV